MDQDDIRRNGYVQGYEAMDRMLASSHDMAEKLREQALTVDKVKQVVTTLYPDILLNLQEPDLTTWCEGYLDGGLERLRLHEVE